jgi:hypothetical protein
VVLKSKHKGCVENLICCWNSLLLLLTHRKLLSKAIAIDNDLRGAGHQSQSDESIGRDNSGLAPQTRPWSIRASGTAKVGTMTSG